MFEDEIIKAVSTDADFLKKWQKIARELNDKQIEEMQVKTVYSPEIELNGCITDVYHNICCSDLSDINYNALYFIDSKYDLALEIDANEITEIELVYKGLVVEDDEKTDIYHVIYKTADSCKRLVLFCVSLYYEWFKEAKECGLK